jgi:hypothetical protein
LEHIVTKIEIELPDALAERANSAGLLSSAAMQDLLEEAMRRQAGRRLIDVTRHLENAGIAPVSMDEIDAEVKAYRTENRARRNPGGGADRT